MKYTYLLINFLTVLFPVALSFDKKVHFFKSWRFIWPGMAVTGLIFLFWDVLFTVKGVWSFNPAYITGISFYHLPLEEVLFFLTVPFACIFIYECLNYYIKRTLTDKVTHIISVCLEGLSTVMIIAFSSRLYTVITFALLLALIIILKHLLKVKWLNRFYMAFALSLIPFYIINGLLTAIPVVLYNNHQNLGIRAGTIPIEDHFYSMALLMMNVAFFEYFRTKGKAVNG